MLPLVRSSLGVRQLRRSETYRAVVRGLNVQNDQERHDILKKLYALMQEHTEDLARIIVRACSRKVMLNLTVITDA